MKCEIGFPTCKTGIIIPTFPGVLLAAWKMCFGFVIIAVRRQAKLNDL